MNTEQTKIIEECLSLSMAGGVPFSEIVARLIKVGVERYHVDYSRMETTYYLSSGDSTVVRMKHDSLTVEHEFSAATVETSVRQSQRGEIIYPQFLRQTAAAGCIGYFVQLAGKRVHYFGRNGEIHTEWFPGADRRP